MSIFNKRNALIGWAVLTFGKRAAKRKARGAAESVVPSRGRSRAAAAGAAGAAALVGALAFWKRRRSPDDERADG